MAVHARLTGLATALTFALWAAMLERAGAATAQASDTFSLDAARIDTPPTLDGTIDDPAWKQAAHAQLTWDIAYQRPAADTTDVYVLTDDKALYVAFVAQQSATITASQRTNDIGLGTDDVVRVYIWPSGDKGFEYFFAANPLGTRYSYSSENTAFAPSWLAVAKATTTGYIVTERIPLGAMRCDGRSSWRIQFDRRVQTSERQYEWAHASGQTSVDSSFYAGYLNGMQFATTSTRTKPRVGVYALGQIASPNGGGSTSRTGADFSFPVTPTASVFGTLHPDYSNVEIDQQTISPTAFQRQYIEVRPFFTQGANVYNDFNCNDCTIYPWLYTPNIPTPAYGYALEGVQSSVNVAAFLANGAGRTDTSQSANWSTIDHRLGMSILHTSVSDPSLTDHMTLAQLRLGNVHNFSVYASDATDRGSNVTDETLADYRDAGMSLFTPKSGIFIAYRSSGAQFNPVDAFVPITDVAGPSFYAYKEWDLTSNGVLRKINVSQDIQQYHNRQGVLNLADDITTVTIDTRQQLTLTATTGSSWLLLNGQAGNNNQNGFNLTYEGQTSTPATYSYNFGRYGDGFLHSTVRSVTLRAGVRGTATLEADDTDYQLDVGPSDIQWLERFGYAYQIGPNSSFSLGLRRIIGTGPYFGVAPQYINASNVSAAYYRKFGHAELYCVYGDPNAQSTKPAFVAKLIYYLGAEKGT